MNDKQAKDLIAAVNKVGKQLSDLNRNVTKVTKHLDQLGQKPPPDRVRLIEQPTDNDEGDNEE